AMLLDRLVRDRAHEARPARTAVVLVRALEQRLSAPGAEICAGCLVLLVFAGERALGAVLAQDPVLLRRQPLAPLGVGEDHLVGHGRVSLREQIWDGLADAQGAAASRRVWGLCSGVHVGVV